jgi:hypothetical protein
MPYYKAVIEVLVNVEDEAEACDAISEALRPILRTFEPASCWIDWRYHNSNSVPHGPFQHPPRGFEYA